MESQSQYRVLVVDDEADFVTTVIKRLAKRQFEACGAASGEEALQMMRGQVFDVVLLDIRMPGGMDGIDALREIKRLQPDAEVILLTGHASVETSIEGMKEGAFDYLLKPIHLEELLHKIMAACARRSTQQRQTKEYSRV